VGDLRKAHLAFKRAIKADPTFAKAHHFLGSVLAKTGNWNDALAAYRKAAELAPSRATAQADLGVALNNTGSHRDALKAFDRALALDDQEGSTWWNRGISFTCCGLFEEALHSMERALDLGVSGDFLAGAPPNAGLAIALARRRVAIPDPQPDEVALAIKFARIAVEVVPKEPSYHHTLGWALFNAGKWSEALAAYDRAVRLDPGNAWFHYCLANALRTKGELDGAIASYKKALHLKPDYAEAHCNLGHRLRETGRFKEALAAMRRGHELGSSRPGWPYPSAKWVEHCERLVALDDKLPKVLRGEANPADAREQLALASLCRAKKLHAAEARFFKEALVAEPALVEAQSVRYNAACAAALAGCGVGEHTDTLDDAARAQWRAQALAWLRAELDGWKKQVESDDATPATAAHKMLAHSKGDPDLAGIRDEAALAKLPADEREAWRVFWAEVDSALARGEQD